MAVYEVVMTDNIGVVTQFVEAETKPTIKEMNSLFDKFMLTHNLSRVSEVREITQEQFNRWNKSGAYKLIRYKSKKSSNKNIIQVKCIQKFRDKQGKIYGYRLVDLNGQTQDVKPDNLKRAIERGQLHVVNLTLTSDNRLVDTNEKQLKSKELGRAPKLHKYEDVAKALIYLDKQIAETEDKYLELARNRVDQLDGGSLNIEDEYELKNMIELLVNPEVTIEESVDNTLRLAYIKMLNSNTSEITKIIREWQEFGSYDIFESKIQSKDAKSIIKSTTYNSLMLVYKYAKEKKLDKEAVKQLQDFLDRLRILSNK